MREKQRMKSQQTRRELKAAALDLFRQRGYEGTTVSDIVGASGYSVGAFYGHFKSKQEVAAELWGDYIGEEIRLSTERGRQIEELEELFDYLISRSEELAADPLFSELQKTYIRTQENKEIMHTAALDYNRMLREALLRQWPQTDEQTAAESATAAHCLLNAYAEQGTREPAFALNRVSMKRTLLYIAQMCAPKTIL